MKYVMLSCVMLMGQDYFLLRESFRVVVALFIESHSHRGGVNLHLPTSNVNTSLPMEVD
jgi:hypothetical protein